MQRHIHFLSITVIQVILLSIMQIQTCNGDESDTSLFETPPASEPLFSISGYIASTTQNSNPDEINLPSWTSNPDAPCVAIIARGRENKYGGIGLIAKNKVKFVIFNLPSGIYDLAVICYTIPYVSRIGYFLNRVGDELNAISGDPFNDIQNCIEEYTHSRTIALKMMNEDTIRTSLAVSNDYIDYESGLIERTFSNAKFRNRAISELAKKDGKIIAAREERRILNVFGTKTNAYAFCIVDLSRSLRGVNLVDNNPLFERLDLTLIDGDWKIRSRDGLENDLIRPTNNGPYIYKGYVCFELDGDLVGVKVGPETGDIQLKPVELKSVSEFKENKLIGGTEE